LLRGEEQRRIEGNLITIRHYLKSKFPGYTITEHSVPSLYHEFTVTPNLDFKTSFHSARIGMFKGNGSKNVT